MSESPKKRHKGIATLFDKNELKKYFKNYLILIGFAEIFVFFVSFVSQMGPENVPFPWRSYFFAAFIVPIAITFILGLCIMGFNSYLYGDTAMDQDNVIAFPQDAQAKGYLYKFQVLLYSIRQIPLFIGFVLLAVSAGIIYKIDDILIFIGHAGEKTAQYLLISLAAALAVATLFGLIWMMLNYKLRKKSMEYTYRYRSQVVKHTGLIIMDDSSMVDNEGNVIADQSIPAVTQGKNKTGRISLLPNFSDKNKKSRGNSAS